MGTVVSLPRRRALVRKGGEDQLARLEEIVRIDQAIKALTARRARLAVRPRLACEVITPWPINVLRS